MNTSLQKCLVLIATLFFAQVSVANENIATGFLGLDTGALSIGGQLEHKYNDHYGFGGFALYSAEKKNNGVPVKSETITLGGFFATHIPVGEKVDISLAPGFGVTMVEAGNNDETIFGALLKVGMFYDLGKVDIGVEMLKGYNLFNDEVQGTIDYYNFAVRFHL